MTARDPNNPNQDVTAAGTTGQRSSTGTDQVQQSAGAVADQTKQAAAQVTDQAKEAARSQLSTRKDQAANGLSVISSAIQDMGDRLRQSDQTSSYAGVVDQAAHQVQRLSGYLRNRDVRQIVNEAEDFARRDPALVLGGAFVLGLLAARFLKSSGLQTSSSMRQSRGYNPIQRTNYPAYPAYQDPRYGTTYRPSSRYWDERTGAPDTGATESRY